MIKAILFTLSICFISFLSSPSLYAEAVDMDDLNQIRKDSTISLDAFDKKSQAFRVIISAEPDVGPNYAKVQDVVDALEYDGGLEKFKKDMPKLKSAKLVLKKNLKLLSDEELEKFNLQ